MKTFDPTKPFTCRDPAYKAEILCTDLSGDYPIVCKVTKPDGERVICTYKVDGRYYNGGETEFDLINVPEKKTAWAVVCANGAGFIASRGFVSTYKDDPGVSIFPIEYTVGQKDL